MPQPKPRPKPNHPAAPARLSSESPFPMKALVITRLGGPEVLEIQQVATPHPTPDQVLVNVEACGLNFADLMTTQGGYATTPDPPLTAGREFAGSDASTGRRVMGYTQWAAFAEQTAAARNLLWPVPQNWTAEQAAAFPVNFFTAYFAYWKAACSISPALAFSFMPSLAESAPP